MARRHRGSKRHRALSNARWEATRRQVFKRDGYRCTLCGLAGRLHAHHVRPLHLHPEQDPYDPAGSVTYCRSCHIDHHRRPVSAEALAWRALVAELRPKTGRRATRRDPRR